MTVRGASGWHHERRHNYNQWTYRSTRTFGWREVEAVAVVDSYGADNDSPANWEVTRDGSPVARGHGTVKEAKSAAFRAMWKAAQPRFRSSPGQRRGEGRDVCVGSDCWHLGKTQNVKRPLGKRKAGA